jgi:hypothetical protein
MASEELFVWGYAPVAVGVLVEDGKAARVTRVVVLDSALALPTGPDRALAVRPHVEPRTVDERLADDEVQDLGLAVATDGLREPSSREAAAAAIVFARGAADGDEEMPAWQAGW